MSARHLEVSVPRKLAPLLRPSRYKGAHGGRGGAKSHFFAEQLVLRCYSRLTRAVCIREVQKSIKESVRQLLIDKITKLGLLDDFEILETEIRCKRNGSLIIFVGMQAYNAANIKSLEGFDVAWVEEAQTLSEVSLRMLRPTIRKEGSELWFSWNPRHDTDAVDVLLRQKTPAGAIVVEVNWPDNPWFPDVLRDEMEGDYAADPEMAEHVWGGGYEIVSEGAYFARWISAAEREGRVGHFPYNPSQRLRTSWDLGIDDYMATWFIQDDGAIPTIVDYYEANGDGFDDYIAGCMPEIFIPPTGDDALKFIGWDRERALNELDRDGTFKYDCHFLPHDVAHREIGAGGRHRWQSAQRLGLLNIRKGVAANPEDRVSAARSILPLCRFNDTPRVQHGLKRLRRYKRKFNDLLGTYQGPLKDGNDHGADAFGEYAINCDLFPRKEKRKPRSAPKGLVIREIGPGGAIPNMSPKEYIDMIKRERRRSAR